MAFIINAKTKLLSRFAHKLKSLSDLDMILIILSNLFSNNACGICSFNLEILVIE